MLAMPDDAAARRGRLAQRRKAVGQTQEQLAARLGVERTTVVRWEAWQQALAILENLQHPDADQVRAKLASTNTHASPNPSA
jgi:transcriptional regulator with XRE-family HTH domain